MNRRLFLGSLSAAIVASKLPRKSQCKVEILNDRGVWSEVAGLHVVTKGQQFRTYRCPCENCDMFESQIYFQGTAAEDGFLDENGIGNCPFDLTPGDISQGALVEA